MSVGTKHLILCQQQSLDSAHQCAALTGKVGKHFPFEVGFKQITRSHANAQCYHTLERPSGSILEDGVRRVEAAPLEEHFPKGSTRSFRCYQDHIHIGRRDNARTLFVGDPEAMREVKGLACCQVRFDAGPYFNLRRIGEQVLDDGCPLACFLNLKQRFARHPTIGHSLIPGFTALALPHNHVEAIVTQIERLARSLYPVANHGDCFVL